MKAILVYTIPGPPRTKKNSQRMIQKNGRWIPIPSADYKEFEERAGFFVKKNGGPLSCRLEVTATFYMPTRRKVDLVNLLEAVDDILVKYGVVADDNSDIIVSHDGSRVAVDKNNPRTVIYIRKLEEEKCQ